MLLFPIIVACGSSGPSLPVDRLIRASMTLRGVRPSMDEIREVLDGAPLEPIARSWLADPRFGETLRDLHAQQLLLRYDTRNHAPPVGPLASVLPGDLIASLDEEPLRLIEHLVMEGRPYTEIVTTDLTMADERTSVAYGTTYPEGAAGWQEARYLDGRPAAGILSTTALLQRHMNSDTNHHRTRANLVLSVLLCDPVAASAVTDPTVDADDPACQGCHARLDPVASSFYGFGGYFVSQEIASAYDAGCPVGAPCYPLEMWDPALEANRAADGMPDPGLDGAPASDLAALGRAVADDPRFATCTARRFLSYLAQIAPERVDEGDVERFADRFVASGYDARELALAIAIDPALGPDRTPPRVVPPEALSRMMDDLVGWRWEAAPTGYGTIDFGSTDEFGFRSLMGGVDGWNTVRPDRQFTATRELGLEWLAEEAASVAVDRHRLPIGGPVDRRGDVRDALRDLHLRMLGEPDPDLEPSEALFDAALERSGRPADAWKVTLTALFLDERLVTY